MVKSCVEYFELKSLLDGRMDGWVNGWESRVKDCLQQSKISLLLIGYQITHFIKNKTGMDQFQDCCKAKATNTLLQS